MWNNCQLIYVSINLLLIMCIEVKGEKASGRPGFEAQISERGEDAQIVFNTKRLYRLNNSGKALILMSRKIIWMQLSFLSISCP